MGRGGTQCDKTPMQIQGHWRRRQRRYSRCQSKDSPTAWGGPNEANIHTEAHGDPTPEKAQWKKLQSMKSTHWRRLLMEITIQWRKAYAESLYRRFSLKTCGLIEDPQWSNLWRTAACGSAHVEEFHKGLSPVAATPQQSRERAWEARKK